MERKKRVIILGGGISGLTAAYRLRDACDVLLIEEKGELGGSLKAAKTFARAPELLKLANELGLKPLMLPSKSRYLFINKKLRRPLPLLLSQLPALFRERKVLIAREDESIAQFAERRFGKTIAELFFDPMTLGVYGGKSSELSLQACFPRLAEWEREFGSIVKAFWKKRTKHALFSIPLDSLISALQEKITYRCNERATGLTFGQKVIVETSRATYEADEVISALPAYALASLLQDDEIALSRIPYKSLTCVNFGFEEKCFEGFGYLVPTREKEPILGVIFDSEERCTVFLDGIQSKEVAWEALKRHLRLKCEPKIANEMHWHQKIPQFFVGYPTFIAELEKKCAEKYPRLTLLGSYIAGVSVNDCIKRAAKRGSLNAESRT